MYNIIIIMLTTTVKVHFYITGLVLSASQLHHLHFMVVFSSTSTLTILHIFSQHTFFTTGFKLMHQVITSQHAFYTSLSDCTGTITTSGPQPSDCTGTSTTSGPQSPDCNGTITTSGPQSPDCTGTITTSGPQSTDCTGTITNSTNNLVLVQVLLFN